MYVGGCSAASWHEVNMIELKHEQTTFHHCLWTMKLKPRPGTRKIKQIIGETKLTGNAVGNGEL